MSFLLGLLLLLAPTHSFAEAPKLVFAQTGNTVTLPRVLWGAEDNIHVNWYFNNNPLISRHPTASSPKQVPPNWQGRVSLSLDFSLVISPVNESDFGIFICEQFELLKTITTTYKLYHVRMSTPPPLLADASLSLSCELEREGFKLFPHTAVTWLGPDKKTYTGKSYENKHTLTVTKVSKIHSGNWICKVEYDVQGRLEAITNVIIVDLIQSLDPIYAADSSSNFAIPCSLSSKIPWSTVNATGVKGGSWSFVPLNGFEIVPLLLELHPNPSPAWKIPTGSSSLLMESEVKNHQLDVKISKVSIKHRGNFTCSLDFKLKTLSSRVQVEVLQIISSAGKALYEGNMLNLTCTLGHPMPSDLEVNWKPPHSSSLPNLRHPHPTNLSIPAVRVKDSGSWACELKKNATVLAKATVIVKIVKAPVDIWLVVAITGGILVIVLLSVIAFIIIRRHRKVMKYTRRKRRLCCCKNPQPKGFYKT